VPSALSAFIVRRVARAALLVLASASAALLLVHLAPGDAFSGFDVDPAFAAAERSRLGFDRPFLSQYAAWLGRLLTLDFGVSVRFHRPVADLLVERLGNTLVLGTAALVIALGIGLPAGVLTGRGRPTPWARAISGVSLLLVSMPPLVTALVLLFAASRTGWLPSGGLAAAPEAGVLALLGTAFRYLPLPALALALPIAASLERLQSQAIGDALGQPCVTAALARGISPGRATWVHAWRLSLTPVLGVLGIVVGSVLSGSFIVEIVMSWPGLGDLMYQALVARDVHLAAGCVAVGGALLSLGLLAADVALAVADPRLVDTA
jgi:ABC-type dipeptide/oligopeptide/nickel transport system permease component